MKRVLIKMTFVLGGILLLLSGCDGCSTSSDSDNEPEQVMNVKITKSTTSNNGKFGTNPPKYYFDVTYVLFGANFKQIKINNETFYENDIYSEVFQDGYQGDIDPEKNKTKRFAAYSEGAVNIALETNVGSLVGSIDIPAAITNVSHPTKMALGEDLILDWDCENADYYQVWLRFEGANGKQVLNYFPTQSQLTVSGKVFTNNGIIEVAIFPNKGINFNTNSNLNSVKQNLESKSSQANLTGSGIGFLNSTSTAESFEKDITIGSGRQ